MPIGFIWQTFLETPLINLMVALSVIMLLSSMKMLPVLRSSRSLPSMPQQKLALFAALRAQMAVLPLGTRTFPASAMLVPAPTLVVNVALAVALV